ncbi:MAG: ribonuclease P protein component [Candidatus Aminicenantes bacterium]|nr:ribonuclease P protein component [Candidatus Aminicenantes bacterium]
MIESYGPRERIRKKKDFTNLYKKGSCARGRFFNLICFPNGLGHSRMAAVTSKKVGNAVQRNRIRRRARELFRKNKDLLIYPLDILLIAKKDIGDATRQDLLERYRSALQAIRERR